MSKELLSELRELMREAFVIEEVQGLCNWDQEVMMPRKGAKARAQQMEVLAAVHHRMITKPRIGELLDELEGADLDANERAFVREAAWWHRRATRVPEKLASRIAKHMADSLEAWREARRKSDFSIFAPFLEKMIELKREYAACVEPDADPYEAVLHDFEPHAKLEDVRSLLEEAKDKLASLLQKVLDADKPSTGILDEEVKQSVQDAFGRKVYEALGYDFDDGRLDVSTHPATFHVGDTRITTRYTHGWKSALSAGMHEVGHALYDQGLPVEEYGIGPLAQPRSLGVHESQSRLWENHVGLSKEFWSYWFPKLKESYGFDVSFDEFYAAINKVEADFIRVEADELTYPLHVILRFEIEQELMSGKLSVKDAPARWNALTKELLGITPPDDARGILQDIHWAHGLIGYFPTYVLGSMVAAQLFAAACEDIEALPAKMAQGKNDELLEWLRTHVHRRGCVLMTDDLVEQATGKPLSIDAYVTYLTEKYSEIYGL